jgi:guanosine-3',5'-bis(diphosphate) 3'-pyrophosphohydrolase
MLVAVGEGKISQEAFGNELVAAKGLKRRKSKSPDLPAADKAEGWFALRATDTFRFQVDMTQRSGPRAREALAQLDFNTGVEIAPQGVVPGERPVGIMEPGRPMVIYPIDSEALVEMHDSDVAWVDVRWDLRGSDARYYKRAITMLSQNKPGSLAQISAAIASCDANIHNLVMRMASPDFHKLIFEIEVHNAAQLNDVLSTLKLTNGLSRVRRATLAEAREVANMVWGGEVEREEELA